MTVRESTDEEATHGPTRAVVVGGGLAGVTTALSLATAGVRVTLLEGRPRLGGLAFSFNRRGLDVDNGQHVFLRCCTAYRALLERMHAADLVDLQERLEVPVLDASAVRRDATGTAAHRYGLLRRRALPVPAHLAGSLALYPHLSPRERADVARATLALGRLDPDDPALDGYSFADWLRARHQSPRAIAALWDLVGVATLNATAEQTSLALAVMVFRTGLLSAPGAADIGFPRAPLGRLHHDRAGAALAAAGVRVRLRTKVDAVEPTGDGPRGASPQTDARYVVWTGQERLPADVVVLAVPQEAAHSLLPDGALADPGRLLKLRNSPIVNLHVVYDRPVLRRPFLAMLGSPLQWVFDRTDQSGLAGPVAERGDWHPPGSQYLALSQSSAEHEIDQSTAELRRQYVPELARVFPAARGAQVRDFFVTRERTATFAPAPGTAELRPGQRTAAPGLYLAGAWTATGWPATMEGAVRSGLRAAHAALSTLGRQLGPELRTPEANPEVTRTSGVAA